MKKFISGLLAVALLVSVFIVPTSAKMDVDEAEFFHSHLINFEKEIDVSEFGYSVSEINNLAYDLYELKYEYADLFFLDGLCGYNHVGDKVVSVSVKYTYTKEEVKFVEEYAKENFLSKLNDDWSDLEKILYIHDKMVTDFQYDVRLFDSDEYMLVGRDIYEMFSYKQGVCQAYSNTFMYLMEKIGIECKLVASDASSHEWNAVKLDGEWYHIDVTQDDPVYLVDNNAISKLDLAGRVEHKYFLLSDNALLEDPSEGDHYDWYYLDEKPVICNSDKYLDGYIFSDAVTAFVPIGEDWCFIKQQPKERPEELEFKLTRDFKNNSDLFSIPAQWDAVEENQFWPGCYTGLSRVGGLLIYNTDKEVVSYDVKAKKKQVLYTLSDIKKINTEIPEKAHIYGSTLKDGKIYCQISLSPIAKQYYTVLLDLCANGHKWVVDTEKSKEATKDNDGLKVEFCAFGCGETRETVIPAFGDAKPGDCNGDNQINAADLAILKKGIAGLEAMSPLMDCDRNGAINAADLATLKKFIAGLIDSLV